MTRDPRRMSDSPAEKMQATVARNLAAVDLGSNSFHMIVARLEDRQPRILDRLREPVRLASGLDANKNLSEEVQEKALDCLRRFGQRLRDFDSGSVRAVGTNTLRAAHNSGEFLRRAGEALGHSIDIISGIEEARLIYRGVTRSLPDMGVQRLVVDIGGGSTELIIGQGETPMDLASLYMGCVSATRRWFGDGAITAKAMGRVHTSALQELETVEARYRKVGWQEAVGASGTIRAVSAFANRNGWCEPDTITRSALKSVRRSLIDAGSISQLPQIGVPESRAPVFAGGVAILRAIFDSLELESMRVSKGALREGLLHDLIGRIRHEDIRDRSVQALSVRFGADPDQASRVERTAFALLAAVAEDWELAGEEPSRMIAWACFLHEIGLNVAYSQYHKHGAYILRNANLAGFTRQEQEVLAVLVLSHRRRFPAAAFKALPEHWIRPATRLGILLRLSVALNRSRSDASLPNITANARKKSLELIFPHEWLQDHPLTMADLESESALLEASGFTLEYR